MHLAFFLYITKKVTFLLVGYLQFFLLTAKLYVIYNDTLEGYTRIVKYNEAKIFCGCVINQYCDGHYNSRRFP